MNSEREIASKHLGCRRICGTDWPIEHILYRVEFNGKLYWKIVYYLCNGIPDSSKPFKTRKQALSAFDTL